MSCGVTYLLASTAIPFTASYTEPRLVPLASKLAESPYMVLEKILQHLLSRPVALVQRLLDAPFELPVRGGAERLLPDPLDFLDVSTISSSTVAESTAAVSAARSPRTTLRGRGEGRFSGLEGGP